ncbi:hypothetical protein BGZ47_011536, partial [Haplosporangium gracile]
INDGAQAAGQGEHNSELCTPSGEPDTNHLNTRNTDSGSLGQLCTFRHKAITDRIATYIANSVIIPKVLYRNTIQVHTDSTVQLITGKTEDSQDNLVEHDLQFYSADLGSHGSPQQYQNLLMAPRNVTVDTDNAPAFNLPTGTATMET